MAFLGPLFREAIERSLTFKRSMKKRYWANVSEPTAEREDAARSVLRRAKRRIPIKDRPEQLF